LSRSKDTNKDVVATHVNQLRLCGTEHKNKVPFAEKQRKFTWSRWYPSQDPGLKNKDRHLFCVEFKLQPLWSPVFS